MHVWRERGGHAGALVVLVAALAAPAALARGDPLSACEALHQKYTEYGGAERWASEYGRPQEVHVYAEARAPSRAAAALLVAGLRHRLRYRRVSLRPAPATLCDLAGSLRPSSAALDDPHTAEPNLVLIPAAVWGATEEGCAALQQGDAEGAAPPRLSVQGAGAAPARLRLLAHLARRASRLPLCQRVSRWSFYRNDRTLETCLFLFDESKSTSRGVIMYYPAERSENATSLAKRAARFGLRLEPVPLEYDSAPRREMLKFLLKGNSSFLFLDYETWSSRDRVHTVDPPPDENELDLTYTVRVADTWRLRRVAPDILQAFHGFEPKAEDLRKVLEIEAESPDLNVTEAACTVALNNSKFESWFDLRTHTIYEMAVYLCQDDPFHKEYEKALIKLNRVVEDEVNKSFEYEMSSILVECGDEHSLMRSLIARAQSVHWVRFAGAVAAGAGGGAAAAVAGALDAALVLYDVPAPPRASPHPAPHAARLATGSLDHLVRALQHFVTKYGWTRVAVLSEYSHLASALVKSLNTTSAFTVRDFAINSSPKSALKTLIKSKARIIFVNSNSSVALLVLCAARDLGMTTEAGYVWILREWNVANMTCQRGPLSWRYFTISFWWRGGNTTFRLNGTSVKNTFDTTWPEGTWPLHAAPIADALILLIRGFKHFLHEYPQRKHDLHGGNATRLFWENLDKESTKGVTQTLEWDEFGLKNPLVYIDEWCANRRDPLAVWRVDDGEIKEVYTQRPIFLDRIPSDGSEFCLIRFARDSFSPKCHDGVCFTALAAAALALPALALARRARRRRLQARRLAVTARLLELGGPLAALLVDRAALDLRGEIGAGRFGVVRAAVLRTAGRSIDVAAKALRDESTPAEEREFLNEAVTLASLRHERVVRIVGVCVGGGPPLVLMERAFFRDLLGYLRERRPLVAGEATGEAAGEAAGEVAGEAAHVAAAALTRLARQAAAALEYLGAQGVVHRDVRAANCLVDSRRSLKLADFGLARRTGAGGEYSCQRRGLLPVPWMAPESLERGVFSAASDAWGLGVLLLELVTLGARPYGAWPPQRVLRYVSAGGRPPLPPDVTPETRRALAGCWRRAARSRTTAAALGAELRARPALLAPALRPALHDDQDDWCTTPTQAGVALLER